MSSNSPTLKNFRIKLYSKKKKKNCQKFTKSTPRIILALAVSTKPVLVALIPASKHLLSSTPKTLFSATQTPEFTMGSKNKNKNKRKNRSKDGSDNNKNKKIITDSRFASVHSDPRFQNVPKQKSKVAIDSRFDRMFTDKNFASSTAPFDKRGKPKKNLKTSKSSLQHYYRIEAEDKKSDEDEEIEEEERRNETDSESELKEAADVSSGSGTEEEDDDDVSESTTDDEEEDVDFDEGPEEEV